MSKILGVNLSHHNSICQLSDGKIDFFYDEGRVSRIKEFHLYLIERHKHNLPFEYLSIKKHVKQIDYVIYSSFGGTHEYNIIELLQKQLNYPKYYFFEQNHHIYHALCGFHLSKFDEAIVVTMDGGGAVPLKQFPNHREVECIFYVNNNTIKNYYSHLTNIQFFLGYQKSSIHGSSINLKINDTHYEISSKFSSGQKFSWLTIALGIASSGIGSGKTMGLAAYGELFGDRPEDLARQLQEETRIDTINLIKKAISYNNCKNIILSGGFSLNCTNNYQYLKEFPEHNFFIDPIGHDGGISLGAALYLDRLKRKLNIH